MLTELKPCAGSLSVIWWGKVSERGCSARRDQLVFMERSLAVVWTCLLGAGLVLVLPSVCSITTVTTVPRPPQLIRCVFMERANVTCYWEAGDTPATNYTLEVWRIGPRHEFSCTTTGTHCTAITNSTTRIRFCVAITAHSHGRNISSQPRCQSGRTEVMLPPVTLSRVKPVRGSPHCLNVTWNRDSRVFPVSNSDIKRGELQSQIEFTAQGQLHVQDSEVRDYTFPVCLFRPDTSYTIRLRHRYKGPESPWSLWSNAIQGRTGEDAPSAPPALWRRVKETDKNGRRLISLLWKPLPHPLANGRVLFYNVTCRTEKALILDDHGSCRDLHHTNTSCSLRLPAGRCSCALTASTSAGTSPEARIWFPGASEREPPAPSQVTASPLDDTSLDVRWTAPLNLSIKGFVVEWFAVREKNSSILHWEKLNSSCRALIITEGVKPMERYVVSVKALYGERGAGNNRTVYNYTRQGAPSAGPEVHVHQISGGTVELIWSPVPVEQLHGFIRNYTISYSTANQPAKRVVVPGHVHRYSLENLSPGNYDIFMQANTDAGAGPAVPSANVHIGSEEISIVMCALLPLMLPSLVLMACLAQNKMVKQKLCQYVPDPSHSSLAHWTPKTALEGMKRPAMTEKTDVKYSEVILLGESELQSSDPDGNLDSQSVCNLQTYTCCPRSVSAAQTPQSARKSEKKYIKTSTKAKSTSNTDFSSCNSIYSSILVSEILKATPAPVLSPSYLQFNLPHNTVSLNDIKLQLGGDSKPSVSLQGRNTTRSYFQTDGLKTLHRFQRQHQSPVSFSDLSSISHSSILLSHPADITSPQKHFPQSIYNSVPSLQPDTFNFPVPLSETFTMSLSPPPHSVFVDLSYCPVQCNP